jgi:hypothetical protein
MEVICSKWNRFVLFALAGSLLCLTSCALGPDAGSKRFEEEQFANLIIRYSSDQTIYRLKPDGRDGEFLRIFDRNEICTEAEQLGGPRQLAVVLIDYVYAHDIEREIIDGWSARFKELNFQRVVFLRAWDKLTVNGLRIVADVQLSQSAARDSGQVSLGSL